MVTRNRAGKIMLFIAVAFFHLQAAAQQSGVSVSVDRNHILLGEQFTLTIKVDAGLADLPVVFPAFPDSVNHLEVIRRSRTDSARVGGRLKYTQEIIMTGFDSGVWAIPPQAVSIKAKRYTTMPVSITVMSLPLKGTAYNDIKEIITVEGEGFDWKKWLLVLVTITVLAMALRYWWRQGKKKPDLPQVDRSTAFEEAINALKRIKKDSENGKADVKWYYSSVYDVYRNYLAKVSLAPFMQYTTDEILMHTKETLPPDAFSSTAEVLRIADAVKFARYASGPEESRMALDRIWQGIEVINRQKRPF